ncbi:MAG: TetR/AcrR family transcriptional regulator [Actinomycetota bacterium]|nr:TetR/AcrR family transcriptional regulator [Actinomycetota bacterium]
MRGETATGEGEPPLERREAILVAAAHVISKRGVRGLRVEEVASAAGVSPPLLYYHFASRSGLIRAALEHASEQAPSTALRREPTGKDGFTAVRTALLAELDDDRAVRENAVVWGEVSASAVFEPALREDVRRVSEDWCATVAKGIRRGCEDGSIRLHGDPDESAQILITLVDGLCTRWLAGAIDRERARELLSGAIERMLR